MPIYERVPADPNTMYYSNSIRQMRFSIRASLVRTQYLNNLPARAIAGHFQRNDQMTKIQERFNPAVQRSKFLHQQHALKMRVKYNDWIKLSPRSRHNTGHYKTVRKIQRKPFFKRRRRK